MSIIISKSNINNVISIVENRIVDVIMQAVLKCSANITQLQSVDPSKSMLEGDIIIGDIDIRASELVNVTFDCLQVLSLDLNSFLAKNIAGFYINYVSVTHDQILPIITQSTFVNDIQICVTNVARNQQLINVGSIQMGAINFSNAKNQLRASISQNGIVKNLFNSVASNLSIQISDCPISQEAPQVTSQLCAPIKNELCSDIAASLLTCSKFKIDTCKDVIASATTCIPFKQTICEDLPYGHIFDAKGKYIGYILCVVIVTLILLLIYFMVKECPVLPKMIPMDTDE